VRALPLLAGASLALLLAAGEILGAVGFTAEPWLSGNCTDCYDQWERWEGAP
jgi:hypothetical protein